MQTVQLVAAVLAVAATAAAYPGIGSSHISQSIGTGHGIALGHGAGLGHGHDHVDYYAHPEYKFDYAVHDPHTGDVKNQWESRHGDAVKGSYSVADSDGHLRTVEYTADKHNGFQAIVKKGGKVTLHGYGEQDAHNNLAGAGAGHGASHGFSTNIHHAYSYGKGHLGGAGLGAALGGHGAGSLSFGHGYGYGH